MSNKASNLEDTAVIERELYDTVAVTAKGTFFLADLANDDWLDNATMILSTYGRRTANSKYSIKDAVARTVIGRAEPVLPFWDTLASGRGDD